MKRVVFAFILTLSLLNNLSSLIINEIEINPEEGRTGVEWVEIYNDKEDIDISDWEVYDGLTQGKKRFTFPKDTILEEGDYYVIEFDSPVLNNGGDYIVIYNPSGRKMEQSKELKEEFAESLTWQFCDDEWILEKETKGKKNDCPKKEEPLEEVFEEIKLEEPIKELIEEREIVVPNVITLNAQTIKTGKNSEVSDKSNYVFLGILGFIALIVLLFIIRRREKTEFD